MAIRITGSRSELGSRLDLNLTFGPIPFQFNERACWVAPGNAKLYIFHTKRSRWVIGKQMDDGSRCFAFMTDDGSTRDPVECQQKGGVWTTGGIDANWKEDRGMKCAFVAPSNDAFAQLRVQMEGQLKSCGLWEAKDLKAMWKKIDKNGDNEISLSEMDDLATQMVKAGCWPKWMDQKEPLEMAFQATLEESEDRDQQLEQEEFHDLLLNMFWFCKLHDLFNDIDTSDDSMISLQEFRDGLKKLQVQMSDRDLEAEFARLDADNSNLVDFMEFCKWVRERVTPEHNHAFDDEKGVASKAARKNQAENPTPAVISRKKTFADFDALEAKIKGLCNESSGKGVAKLWNRLDFNGNNVVSLAEIDKWVVETWPLLNHKPALMRAFKATTEAGHNKDEYVHKKDFKRLIVNVFYFNKLFWLFDECDEEHDRRMNFKEFQWCLSMCGEKMSARKAKAEFDKANTGAGTQGLILFDEFCRYFTQKQCPQALTDFMADE